jgi:hypothetical protein
MFIALSTDQGTECVIIRDQQLEKSQLHVFCDLRFSEEQAKYLSAKSWSKMAEFKKTVRITKSLSTENFEGILSPCVSPPWPQF